MPNSLFQGSLHTTNTFYNHNYEERKEKNTKQSFLGDASWQHIPLLGRGSGFSNSGFLGVVRGTFSSGTVLSGTSGSLKILVHFHFCEHQDKYI